MNSFISWDSQEKLSLTDLVLERSAYLYRKSVKSNLVRGRSVKGMVGACVYIACRELDISRTIKDISENLQVDRKSIARNYKLLLTQNTVIMPHIGYATKEAINNRTNIVFGNVLSFLNGNILNKVNWFFLF